MEKKYLRNRKKKIALGIVVSLCFLTACQNTQTKQEESRQEIEQQDTEKQNIDGQEINGQDINEQNPDISEQENKNDSQDIRQEDSENAEKKDSDNSNISDESSLNQTNVVSSDSSVNLEITKLEDHTYSESELNDTWGEDACNITLQDSNIKIEGTGAKQEDGGVTITEAGTYVLSGTLTNGQVMIKAGSDKEVHLILNGVNITCLDSAAIYIKKTGKVILTLADGTVNTLTDGTNYTYEDEEKEEPSAVLFSKCDLVMNGTGGLKINANFNDAITCKDSLFILDGTYVIDSVDDGIIGRDLITIESGNFNITTAGDGIKSTNDTDTALGNIIINGGRFIITAKADAIQAEYAIKITDGTFEINTNGGSSNNNKSNNNTIWGMKEAISQETTSSDTTSGKGIKSGTSMELNGGKFIFDTFDDAVHTNGSILIQGGNYNIATGDDGIHADGTLTISGGEITIVQSYEGLEAQTITINGGIIYVTSSDDGINAADKTSSSGIEHSIGMNFGSGSSAQIIINDGYLYVDASGDGLDANGSITMNGGIVFICGPTNSGNGALDFDGDFTLNGGILAAAGSTGMAQPPNKGEQASISMTFSSQMSAKTRVNLADESGTIFFSFAPAKQFQNIIISTPEIRSGNSYTVSVGGTAEQEKDGYAAEKISGQTDVVTLPISQTITYANESGVTTGGENFGGMGGRGQRGENRKVK